MEREKIASELLKIARSLVAGIDWLTVDYEDEMTNIDLDTRKLKRWLKQYGLTATRMKPMWEEFEVTTREPIDSELAARIDRDCARHKHCDGAGVLADGTLIFEFTHPLNSVDGK